MKLSLTLLAPFAIPIVSTAQPVNDDFENATVLTGSTVTEQVKLAWATVQTGDPNYYSATFTNTIWYRWKAPADGNATLRLTGVGAPEQSAFNNDRLSPRVFWRTIYDFAAFKAEAFAGSSLENLALLAKARLGPYTDGFASFPVQAGETYHILLASNQPQELSTTLHLDLNPDVVVLHQPQAQARFAGTSALFTVIAFDQTGLPPEGAFTWYHDGDPIPGASHYMLSLHDLTQANEGSYWATINGANGQVTTASAYLKVVDPMSPVMTPPTLTLTATRSASNPRLFDLHFDGNPGDYTYIQVYGYDSIVVEGLNQQLNPDSSLFPTTFRGAPHGTLYNLDIPVGHLKVRGISVPMNSDTAKCIHYMEQIQIAKLLWASVNDKDALENPGDIDFFEPFAFLPEAYRNRFPFLCPLAGRHSPYQLNILPTCTYAESDGHILPEATAAFTNLTTQPFGVGPSDMVDQTGHNHPTKQ